MNGLLKPLKKKVTRLFYFWVRLIFVADRPLNWCRCVFPPTNPHVLKKGALRWPNDTTYFRGDWWVPVHITIGYLHIFGDLTVIMNAALYRQFAV